MSKSYGFDQEVLDKADKMIRAGHLVFFKFTCYKCGSRQTFEQPNTLYPQGKCEECGEITDLQTKEADIGFILIARIGVEHETEIGRN